MPVGKVPRVMGHVLEVGKELDLHDHCGCHLVPPPPNPLAVGNEVRLAEGALQPGGIHGAALDLEVDLDVHVGRSDMAVRRCTAEKIRDKTTEENGKVACPATTHRVRHRAPPSDGWLPQPPDLPPR